MSSFRASVRAFGSEAKALEPGLREALSTLGVVLDDGKGTCLLVFDAVTEELSEFVRETSKSGRERLAAIAANPSVLRDGGGWKLLDAGASDVLSWEPTRSLALDLAARLERWETIDDLLELPEVRNKLVGHSPVWRKVLRRLVEVGRFTDAPVLLTGESGTGKELAARLIHTLDSRPGKGDLIVLDCTTIVPTLSGSEFFGHERGSFTGAVAAREGAFELADGGTLFLDEVGELPPSLQAELLRVVQEGTYKRVGSSSWRRTSFRLICATNRDLLEEEGDSRFRRDFYYRIAGWTCRLPSLRDRSGDVLILARHFLRELIPTNTPDLEPAVHDFLVQRDYPGNVRELRQLVARICVQHVGSGPITLGDLPEEERPSDQRPTWPDPAFEGSLRRALAFGVTLPNISRTAGATAIDIALDESDGSVQGAARLLGVTPRALQMRRAARRDRGERSSEARQAG